MKITFEAKCGGTNGQTVCEDKLSVEEVPLNSSKYARNCSGA